MAQLRQILIVLVVFSLSGGHAVADSLINQVTRNTLENARRTNPGRDLEEQNKPNKVLVLENVKNQVKASECILKEEAPSDCKPLTTILLDETEAIARGEKTCPQIQEARFLYTILFGLVLPGITAGTLTGAGLALLDFSGKSLLLWTAAVTLVTMAGSTYLVKWAQGKACKDAAARISQQTLEVINQKLPAGQKVVLNDLPESVWNFMYALAK